MDPFDEAEKSVFGPKRLKVSGSTDPFAEADSEVFGAADEVDPFEQAEVETFGPAEPQQERISLPVKTFREPKPSSFQMLEDPRVNLPGAMAEGARAMGRLSDQQDLLKKQRDERKSYNIKGSLEDLKSRLSVRERDEKQAAKRGLTRFFPERDWQGRGRLPDDPGPAKAPTKIDESWAANVDMPGGAGVRSEPAGTTSIGDAASAIGRTLSSAAMKTLATGAGLSGIMEDITPGGYRGGLGVGHDVTRSLGGTYEAIAEDLVKDRDPGTAHPITGDYKVKDIIEGKYRPRERSNFEQMLVNIAEHDSGDYGAGDNTEASWSMFWDKTKEGLRHLAALPVAIIEGVVSPKPLHKKAEMLGQVAKDVVLDLGHTVADTATKGVGVTASHQGLFRFGANWGLPFLGASKALARGGEKAQRLAVLAEVGANLDPLVMVQTGASKLLRPGQVAFKSTRGNRAAERLIPEDARVEAPAKRVDLRGEEQLGRGVKTTSPAAITELESTPVKQRVKLTDREGRVLPGELGLVETSVTPEGAVAKPVRMPYIDEVVDAAKAKKAQLEKELAEHKVFKDEESYAAVRQAEQDYSVALKAEREVLKAELSKARDVLKESKRQERGIQRGAKKEEKSLLKKHRATERRIERRIKQIDREMAKKYGVDDPATAGPLTERADPRVPTEREMQFRDLIEQTTQKEISSLKDVGTLDGIIDTLRKHKAEIEKSKKSLYDKGQQIADANIESLNQMEARLLAQRQQLFDQAKQAAHQTSIFRGVDERYPYGTKAAEIEKKPGHRLSELEELEAQRDRAVAAIEEQSAKAVTAIDEVKSKAAADVDWRRKKVTEPAQSLVDELEYAVESKRPSMDPGMEAARDVRRATKKELNSTRAGYKRLQKEIKQMQDVVDRFSKEMTYKHKIVPRKQLKAKTRKMLQYSERLNKLAKASEAVSKLIDPISLPMFVLGRGKNTALDYLQKNQDALASALGQTGFLSERLSKADMAKLRWYLTAGDNPQTSRFRQIMTEAEGEASALGFDLQDRLRATGDFDPVTSWGKDLDPKSKPGISEMMLFEKIKQEELIRQHVRVNRDAPAGQRFQIIDEQAAPDSIKAWVAQSQEFDWLFDISKSITRDAIEADILRLPPNAARKYRDGDYYGALQAAGLDQAWAHHTYNNADYRAFLEKRLKKKFGSGEAAKALINDILREPRQQLSRGASGLSVRGDVVTRRKLREVDIARQIDEFGMDAGVDALVFNGFLKARRDIAMAKAWRTISKDNTIYSSMAKQGWVKFDNARAGQSQIKKYPGLPDEFYIEPSTAAILKGKETLSKLVGEDTLSWRRTFYKANSYWKQWKTAAEPATHATNTIGNLFFFGPLAGVNILDPRQWDKFQAAAREFTKGQKSAAWREFVESGGLGTAGSLTRNELYQKVHQGFGIEMDGAIGRARRQKANLEQAAKGLMEFSIKDLMGGSKKFIKSVGQDAQALYAAEDNFLRFVKFMIEREKGLSAIDASRTARTSFAAYEHIPGIFQHFSMSPFGAPFVAFNAAMVPYVWKKLKANPGKLLAATEFMREFTDANLNAAMLTEQDRIELRDSMPDYMKDKQLFLGALNPAWAHVSGDVASVNVLKYLPGMDWMPRGDDELWDVPKRAGAGTSPLYNLMFKASGYDPYFESEIPPHKRLGAMLKTFSHSFWPGWGDDGVGAGWAAEKRSAAKAGKAPWGRNVPEPVPLVDASTILGLQIKQHGSRAELEDAISGGFDMQKAKRHVQGLLSEYARDPRKTHDTLKRDLQVYLKDYPVLGPVEDLLKKADEKRVKRRKEQEPYGAAQGTVGSLPSVQQIMKSFEAYNGK